jgi:Protein of unknown function (DUF4197)
MTICRLDTESIRVGARRNALQCLLALAAAGALQRAHALSFADLTQKDATAGLKAALERGAGIAVDLLGRTDGFWANDRVRIPLPEWLQRGERALKILGYGTDVDELRLGINRAAEQAVPESKVLLSNAVKSMTVADAKNILSGGDTAITRFFADKTRAPLTERFLPVVTKVTNRIGLAQEYNSLAAQGERFGVVTGDQVRVERHVTTKALDGLYFMIGEEEKKIRQNPIGTGSDILRKVFGGR